MNWGFNMCVLEPLKGGLSDIFAGKVFHRHVLNTGNDASYNVRCFCLQFLGSGGILTTIQRRLDQSTGAEFYFKGKLILTIL